MATKKAAKKKSVPSEPKAVAENVLGQPLPSSPLYDENEAADYLRISRTTLIRLRQDGVDGLRYTRVGNRVFYTREQLDAYIAACNTDAVKEGGNAANPALARQAS